MRRISANNDLRKEKPQRAQRVNVKNETAKNPKKTLANFAVKKKKNHQGRKEILRELCG
ncbi:MAG: hypothetical protein N3E37_05300 [Candidatus Micrarchaeota archaeon]|nr:hypothetical protein [Candidatus Micrarchaeota archaeon]